MRLWHILLERTFASCLSSVIETIFRYFKAKILWDETARPNNGKKSIQGDSNIDGIRLTNSAASQNLIVGNTTFLHKNKKIHKITCMSPDGKPQTR
jgi:hypothetical protein